MWQYIACPVCHVTASWLVQSCRNGSFCWEISVCVFGGGGGRTFLWLVELSQHVLTGCMLSQKLTDCCDQDQVSSSSSETAAHCYARSPRDPDCTPSWGCWPAYIQSTEGHSDCQWNPYACTSSPTDQACIPETRKYLDKIKVLGLPGSWLHHSLEF
jgi:hypothetical protein